MSNGSVQMPNERDSDDIDFSDVEKDLRFRHRLFSSFWGIGKPIVTKRTPSGKNLDKVGVRFDNIGQYVGYYINPEYWNSLESVEQKSFLISHQILHTVWMHGLRTIKVPKKVKDLVHESLDLIVNHTLVNQYGYSREKADPNDDYHWLDKSFDGTGIDVKEDKFFEYYFNRLVKRKMQEKECPSCENGEGKEKSKMKGSKGSSSGSSSSNQPEDQDDQDDQDSEKNEDQKSDRGSLVDDHSLWDEGEPEDGESKEESQNYVDFQKFLSENLIQQDVSEAFSQMKDQLEQMQQAGKTEDPTKDQGEASVISFQQQCKAAGVSPGNMATLLPVHKKVIKPKWETIITRWSKRAVSDPEEDQWVRENRRFSIMLGSTPLKLPTPMEVEREKFDKIKVWFFLDTSGSCAHLADRFFKAATSLSEEKFDLKLFCFDTRVYPVDIKKRNLSGFGGTSFTCIEQYIQAEIKKSENPQYPKAVFLITDGYGDVVKPQIPERWYFFLSEDYRHCIPKESHIFALKDFE